jgi:hypothetical protein
MFRPHVLLIRNSERRSQELFDLNVNNSTGLYVAIKAAKKNKSICARVGRLLPIVDNHAVAGSSLPPYHRWRFQCHSCYDVGP